MDDHSTIDVTFFEVSQKHMEANICESVGNPHPFDLPFVPDINRRLLERAPHSKFDGRNPVYVVK